MRGHNLHSLPFGPLNAFKAKRNFKASFTAHIQESVNKFPYNFTGLSFADNTKERSDRLYQVSKFFCLVLLGKELT